MNPISSSKAIYNARHAVVFGPNFQPVLADPANPLTSGLVTQPYSNVDQARDLSLRIYNFARDYARQRGIIIADTKFEFGLFNGELLLIDEVLTPDSSRFWPADKFQPGQAQPSFDKQFVRDYLETLAWDKSPPAPSLPSLIVSRTQAKYLEAYERLTGRNL